MTARKNILHIIISLQRGGCENVLLRMLPPLKKDFNHIILTLKEPGPMAPLFEEQGIRVICLKQASIFDILSYPRLLRMVQKEHPNLIITNLLHADIIGRMFLQFFFPCKVISYIGTTYNFARYWPARLFERLSKHLADGYMANAESVRKVYIEKFKVSPKKIWTLPRGLDIEIFENTQANQGLYTTLGIREGDFVIICVANLHVNKGHRFLLEAFEQFFQQHPQSTLLVIGDGEEKEILKHQVATYTSRSRILFLGRRTDIPELLSLSHVFVLPTFFEGLANAIMEAMAAKVFVITTDIPENRQLITHQETGLLCPTKNASCIYEALLQIKNNAYPHIPERAYEKIKKEYSMPEKVQLWNDFFHQLS